MRGLVLGGGLLIPRLAFAQVMAVAGTDLVGLPGRSGIPATFALGLGYEIDRSAVSSWTVRLLAIQRPPRGNPMCAEFQIPDCALGTRFRALGSLLEFSKALGPSRAKGLFASAGAGLWWTQREQRRLPLPGAAVEKFRAETVSWGGQVGLGYNFTAFGTRLFVESQFVVRSGEREPSRWLMPFVLGIRF